jgi:hypothetical protein
VDEDLRRFADDLSELRLKAGNPSYRSLAQLTHFSRTTLAQAASGRTLPSLPVTLAFVRACQGDPQQWEQRWHGLHQSALSPARPSIVSPAWPGQSVADGAEPEAAGCAHDAVTAHARKVAYTGRRLILGQIELRHCARAHAAWGRFEGFASLDNLARKRELVEILVEVFREADDGHIDFREEYAGDYHWTDLLLTGSGLFWAAVEIYFDGELVASAQTDKVELS